MVVFARVVFVAGTGNAVSVGNAVPGGGGCGHDGTAAGVPGDADDVFFVSVGCGVVADSMMLSGGRRGGV